MSDTTNPKDALGVKKAPLRFVPPALVIEVAPAMANGAAKYGAFNWRDKSVRATIYFEAIQRHLYQWLDGEDRAQDSGVKHLGHVGACIAILLDAEANGNLIDDRPVKGPASALLDAQDHSTLTEAAKDSGLTSGNAEPTALPVAYVRDPDDEPLVCACTREQRMEGHAIGCLFYGA